MRLRNIEVSYRHNEVMFFATQTFVDWYDFADWMKQCELRNEVIIIKGWRYVDQRI